jgi:predicted nucleic acid-binding Zn ribbon protein
VWRLVRPEESTQLVRAPKLTVDPASGQLYATVGNEAPQQVVATEVSHLLGTVAIRTMTGEIFVCSLADCPALPGQSKPCRRTPRTPLTSPDNCVVCGASLDQPATGRTRQFCSDICRQQASRKRRRQRKAVRSSLPVTKRGSGPRTKPQPILVGASHYVCAQRPLRLDAASSCFALAIAVAACRDAVHGPR